MCVCVCVCVFFGGGGGCAFFNLCLQVGNLLGFEVVSAVLCLSFGVSCLRD